MTGFCTEKIPKILWKKPNSRISDLSKVSGHEINMQKSIASLYTNDKQIGTEIKNAIPLIIISNKMTYIGIKSTKHI